MTVLPGADTDQALLGIGYASEGLADRRLTGPLSASATRAETRPGSGRRGIGGASVPLTAVRPLSLFAGDEPARHVTTSAALAHVLQRHDPALGALPDSNGRVGLERTDAARCAPRGSFRERVVDRHKLTLYAAANVLAYSLNSAQTRNAPAALSIRS